VLPDESPTHRHVTTLLVIESASSLLQLILVAPDSRDDMDWANPRTYKNSFTHDWYHIEVISGSRVHWLRVHWLTPHSADPGVHIVWLASGPLCRAPFSSRPGAVSWNALEHAPACGSLCAVVFSRRRAGLCAETLEAPASAVRSMPGCNVSIGVQS
jgi:hypothetical protein